VKFRELSDEQWKFIIPHLPPQPIVGRKRAENFSYQLYYPDNWLQMGRYAAMLWFLCNCAWRRL